MRLGGDSFNSRIVYAITSDLFELCKEKVDLTLKVVLLQPSVSDYYSNSRLNTLLIFVGKL